MKKLNSTVFRFDSSFFFRPEDGSVVGVPDYKSKGLGFEFLMGLNFDPEGGDSSALCNSFFLRFCSQ